MIDIFLIYSGGVLFSALAGVQLIKILYTKVRVTNLLEWLATMAFAVFSLVTYYYYINDDIYMTAMFALIMVVMFLLGVWLGKCEVQRINSYLDKYCVSKKIMSNTNYNYDNTDINLDDVFSDEVE